MNGRIMWPSIFITFLVISLLPSAAFAQPPFKSELLSCPNTSTSICGSFYSTVAGLEPLIDGIASVSATGILKVKVNGASPSTTYEVVMISSAGGVFDVVGFLSTDAFGDGVVNIPLPLDTYASGVILMRDSDFGGGCAFPPAFPSCPTGSGADPRIFTGFVIP